MPWILALGGADRGYHGACARGVRDQSRDHVCMHKEGVTHVRPKGTYKPPYSPHDADVTDAASSQRENRDISIVKAVDYRTVTGQTCHADPAAQAFQAPGQAVDL